MMETIQGELVPSGGGDSIPLFKEVLTVGRREKCDIQLDFPNISGMHCEFRFRDGYWYIRDLNSTNGIKVNGMRTQEKLLHPKDEITIGKRRYTISYELPSNRNMLEEMEEDFMGTSLLERAGLEMPRPDKDKRASKNFDPADFLLDDDD